ncbi:AMP-dependent ligase [Streptomyces litmocidini]|uniref:class I adenylate-forming enzyme family protein n=1 Tax=Streptomyces litmocidini TaxID=67318 RepID=UPI00167D721E|nr:class I adenylate-forming enzyme family protein [Streptomyces litmocidini]GGU80635.1 AMP-dependent ligase [Streptomyces litmocidini]
MTVTLLHDLLDRQADRTPDAPALTRGNTTWTYGELRRHSRALAARLAGLGVGRGDRVLVLAPHAAETVAALFAASRLGALYCVVSDQTRPYHLRHILADSEPAAVLATGEAAARAEEEAGCAVHWYDAHTDARAPLDDAPHEDDGRAPCLSVDAVALTYTSGSTAMPKAVVSTHRQVLFATAAIQDALHYRADDRIHSCLPLSFDYGLYQVYLACASGAHLVLGDSSQAGPALLTALRASGATVMPLVPSLASNLLRLLTRSGSAPPPLRLVTNTGAALPPALSARLRQAIPTLAVVPMYGLTECKRVSIAEPDLDLTRPGSVGRPLRDTEVYAADPDGRPLPPGRTGELVVRGPHVMAGYWRAPELTAARFGRDDIGQPLLRTGDRGRVDADGYLYFAGRDDDQYKQRGFRVSAVEVEAAALDVPGVHLAAVLPPSDNRGAVLAVSAEMSAAHLAKELGERLDPVKLPSDYRVLDELPLSVNGKVDKRVLADLLRTLGRGA